MSSGKQSVVGWVVSAVIVAAIAAGCIGFGVHLTQSTSEAVCGGQIMNQGETCTTTVNGSDGEPKTADEQAASQTNSTHVFGWIFVGGGVLVVLGGLLFARAARRMIKEDRAKAAAGGTGPRPAT